MRHMMDMDERERTQMGDSGRQHILENYSMGRVVLTAMGRPVSRPVEPEGRDNSTGATIQLVHITTSPLFLNFFRGTAGNA